MQARAEREARSGMRERFFSSWNSPLSGFCAFLRELPVDGLHQFADGPDRFAVRIESDLELVLELEDEFEHGERVDAQAIERGIGPDLALFEVVTTREELPCLLERCHLVLLSAEAMT